MIDQALADRVSGVNRLMLGWVRKVVGCSGYEARNEKAVDLSSVMLGLVPSICNVSLE
jgi:hypothetical protein